MAIFLFPEREIPLEESIALPIVTREPESTIELSTAKPDEFTFGRVLLVSVVEPFALIKSLRVPESVPKKLPLYSTPPVIGDDGKVPVESKRICVCEASPAPAWKADVEAVVVFLPANVPEFEILALTPFDESV
jgi:hypothetical protein